MVGEHAVARSSTTVGTRVLVDFKRAFAASLLTFGAKFLGWLDIISTSERRVDSAAAA